MAVIFQDVPPEDLMLGKTSPAAEEQLVSAQKSTSEAHNKGLSHPAWHGAHSPGGGSCSVLSASPMTQS